MNFLLGSAKAAPAEKKEPAALAKEWRRNLAKEVRSIDRDVRHSIVEDTMCTQFWSICCPYIFVKVENLRREEKKALTECKKLAKENRVSAAKILAKEVVNTRKAVERMQVPIKKLFYHLKSRWGVDNDLFEDSKSDETTFQMNHLRLRRRKWIPCQWYSKRQYVSTWDLRNRSQWHSRCFLPPALFSVINYYFTGQSSEVPSLWFELLCFPNPIIQII